MENNNYSTLYSNTDKQILVQAEDSLNHQIVRVDEIIEYAKEAKINCPGYPFAG